MASEYNLRPTKTFLPHTKFLYLTAAVRNFTQRPPKHSSVLENYQQIYCCCLLWIAFCFVFRIKKLS